MTPFDCPNCEGAGMSALNQMLGALGGSDAVVDPCPSCGGSGIDPELHRAVKEHLHTVHKEAYGELNIDCDYLGFEAVAALVAYWKEKE